MLRLGLQGKPLRFRVGVSLECVCSCPCVYVCVRGDMVGSEEVSEDVHKVITQKDCDILPEGIQNAIGDFQDNMRNMKAMQEAVAQSQDKVTEYWKKVQAHEALLLEQVRP